MIPFSLGVSLTQPDTPQLCQRRFHLLDINSTPKLLPSQKLGIIPTQKSTGRRSILILKIRVKSSWKKKRGRKRIYRESRRENSNVVRRNWKGSSAVMAMNEYLSLSLSFLSLPYILLEKMYCDVISSESDSNLPCCPFSSNSMQCELELLWNIYFKAILLLVFVW